MKSTMLPLAAAIGLAAATALPAVAQTTLHFDHIGSRPPVIDQGDYRLTCTGLSLGPCAEFGSWDSGDPRYPGADAIFANHIYGRTTLTSHVGKFDLFSIALASLIPRDNPQTVDFFGTLTGGATVFQSFVIPPAPSSPTLATYTFSADFRGLESVYWDQAGPAYHQFNDIVVGPANTVTPEPMSMALLATGLVGVAAVRRRRRRKDGAPI